MLAHRRPRPTSDSCQRLAAVETGDIFLVASLTKLVVAAAILQLVEAGKLRVEDTVATYIPEFARPRVPALACSRARGAARSCRAGRCDTRG
jgi:CubicO group peptidase (beta-lactamase class C family)